MAGARSWEYSQKSPKKNSGSLSRNVLPGCDMQRESPNCSRAQWEEVDSSTVRPAEGNRKRVKRRMKKIRNRLESINLNGNEIPSDTHGPKTSLPVTITWTPPQQLFYAKPAFQPIYLEAWNEFDKAINAIIEIRATWVYVMQEAYCNYAYIYSQLSIPLKKEVILICQKHKEDFAVYDREKKRWLIEPSEPIYRYCYDGEEFKEFEEAKNKAAGNRLLVVGKYTILKQEPNLLQETRTAPNLFKTFKVPKRSLTVGVPGCGKTTYIINNHTCGSLVLTSCAEGAQDVRSRMAKIKGGDPSNYRDSYRTIDSYLLNSRARYSHVWVDEALMEHPGKIFLVSLFSRCSDMFLLGDPNQLPYINRLNAVKLRYDKSSMFFKPSKTLNISYRCPVDVMGILSINYDDGAYSASKVLRSLKTLKCKTFRSLKHIPKCEDTKYLVFKQAEKKAMEKAGYNVSTVHEFQGKEAAHVALVRMSRDLQEPLYRSAAHMLVAMSRHRESFTYYTPVTDELKEVIDLSFTDAELKKYQVNTSLNSTSSNCVQKTSLTSKCYSSIASPSLQSKNSQCPQAKQSLTFESSYSSEPSTSLLAKDYYPPTTKSFTPKSSHSSPSTTSSRLPASNSYHSQSKSTYPRFNSTNYDSYYPEMYYSRFNVPIPKPRDEPSVFRPIIKTAVAVTFAYLLKRLFSKH